MSYIVPPTPLRKPVNPGLKCAQIRQGEVRGHAAPRIGASVLMWLNSLANYTEPGLARVAQNEKCPASKRLAAQRLLRALQDKVGDLADFEPYTEGEKKLQDLRRDGVDTRVLKKAKCRTRTGSEGDVTVEREIELHQGEAARDALNDVIDRSIGRATQQINSDVKQTEEHVYHIRVMGPDGVEESGMWGGEMSGDDSAELPPNPVKELE